MGRAATAQHQTVWNEETSTFVRERDVHFATASHEALFSTEDVPRCDVCQAILEDDEDEEEDRGAGVYVWSRGGEITRENAPLCPTCSGAIFASALGMIDFDDEE